MCGIAGFDLRGSGVNQEQKAMMVAILAVANDTRGGDAFGYVNEKTLGRGLGDIASVALKLIETETCMFHTRKATTGANITANAHPFEIGNIIGAHNGIIINHTELNAKYDRKYEVDSMHLFGHIDEDLEFDDISGYGAIEWVDKRKDGRFHLCKLSGGELSVYGVGKNSKNYQGVVWSSNQSHLQAALKAAGIEAFEFKVESETVYFIENGQFYFETEGGKHRKLELAARASYSMPDWRGGYGWSGHTSQYSSTTPTKTETEEYENLIDSMDEKEEKHFRELWEMEEEDDIKKMLLESGMPAEEDEVVDLTDDTPPYTHADEGDYEWIRGTGWVSVASDGTIISRSGKNNVTKK